jgi:sugar (pentulose or hexulose) kinase
MPQEVIAIFDIGKTNKKFLLFSSMLKPVYQEEEIFREIQDDEGFACDDIGRIETWMRQCLTRVIQEGVYSIRAVNFTTYGASLMHLDTRGNRLTPVYNYLKPMPDGVLDGFYENWGGVEEFSRKTASPALGMLNSGLQALWLKRKKPEVFNKISTILHLPQYLSYLFTGKAVSEYTSIGCHTAMWDFDNRKYHEWIGAEKIPLPDPEANSLTFPGQVDGSTLTTGIGIHDSSASLVPYIKYSGEPFILISTGTWCIFMNPFNAEPLTKEQLQHDSLCYMSIQQEQVKSSRLFMGHIHDVNVEKLNRHYGVTADHYKTVKTNSGKISKLMSTGQGRHFVRDGIPADYIDQTADLSHYLTFADAYHQLMADLVDLCIGSLSLILPAQDETRVIYVSGGFARNELFVRLLAARLPQKKVFTSEVDNATALGAAMVVWESAFEGEMPFTGLGLQAVLSD